MHPRFPGTGTLILQALVKHIFIVTSRKQCNRYKSNVNQWIPGFRALAHTHFAGIATSEKLRKQVETQRQNHSGLDDMFVCPPIAVIPGESWTPNGESQSHASMLDSD